MYEAIKETIGYMKRNMERSIQKVHYFSDECAGQYKNYKNFLNVCHHKEDFSLQCEWNFFATSHGKSPCNVICGTVKRLKAKASLQRPLGNQIFTAQDMFTQCKTEIKGTHFIFIYSSRFDLTREAMTHWLSKAKTVPGTRDYHQFVPLSKRAVARKRLSDDGEFDMKFEFAGAVDKILKAKPGQFIFCKYGSQLFIGMVLESDNDNSEMKVKFMTPSLPEHSFAWPHREDICWDPSFHAMMSINPPLHSTERAR